MATKNGRIALSFLTAALVGAPAIAERPIQERAASRLMAMRGELGLDQEHHFVMRHSLRDELGQTHGRFQQTYKGLKVLGGEVITHVASDGAFLPPTKEHRANIHLNTHASLNASEVLAIVNGVLAPKGAYSLEPTAELVIYPEMVEVPSRRPLRRDLNAEDMARQVLRHTLAYQVHVELENDLDGIQHVNYLVNAHTGAVIKTWNDLHTSATTGSGNSQYSGVVALNTNSTATGFEMRDMTRGTGGTFGNNVVTNFNHGSTGSTATGSIYTDADNTWGDGANYVEGSSTTAANGQTAAVDAMYGMMKSWDFYKNVMGRNGIDGAGKATYSRVHVSNSYDNAFWSDSCFCMTYGDGSSFLTLTSLDVAGHELSHGVCANTADLVYSGESGGLNESNSDIFGAMIEFYARGGSGSVIGNTGGNWNIGEQLATSSFNRPLRYMDKPSKDGSSPDAWSSSLGSIDVHYSSGPNNRMFYFLSQGAGTTSGADDYSSYLPAGMTGIGNDKAARIWYRTLATYLTSSSNYAAARAGAINSAKDLYGAGSAEEAAVWNAYAAINVGAKWAGTANTVTASITTPSANVTIASGASQSFAGSATDSSSTATLTYAWTFGDGGTATGTTASHVFTNTGSANVSYTVTFKATDNTGAIGTATRTVTVTPAPVTPTAPSITSQPASQTVNAGATASFSVTASGTAPFTYQWRKNGSAISGATAAAYTTPATTTADSGSTFSVVVSNSVGTATSGNATLTVNPVVVGTYTEVEANNTIATANVVGSSYSAINGYLTATSDLDYYRLTLAAGQSVTLNMSGPSGVDWDLYLKNSAGSTLKSSLGSTVTETVTYTNTGSTSINVYPEVIVYSGTSATPYNLALSYTTPPPSVTYNEVEANNSIAAANVVGDTATKIVGYIASSTDNDYFKVNVGAGQTLKTVMTGPTGSSYDYDLYFYNAAGTKLASGTGSTTSETVSWTNTGASTAVVYVAVKRYAGSSTTTPYNLAVTR